MLHDLHDDLHDLRTAGSSLRYGALVYEGQPGFVFGELALLYHSPRTATIVAGLGKKWNGGGGGGLGAANASLHGSATGGVASTTANAALLKKGARRSVATIQHNTGPPLLPHNKDNPGMGACASAAPSFIGGGGGAAFVSVWCLPQTAFQQLIVGYHRKLQKETLDFFMKQAHIFARNAEMAADASLELRTESLVRLSEIVEHESFNKGEAIITEGEVTPDMPIMFLHQGSAMACVSEKGAKYEVMRYTPGDFFGELAMLHKKQRRATVLALEDNTTCFFVKGPDFLQVINDNRFLLETFNRQLRKYRQVVENLMKKLGEGNGDGKDGKQSDADGGGEHRNGSR